MIRFLHRFKRKDRENVITIELIERKALERVMPQAQEKAEADICRDCQDRRCLMGLNCREFARRSEAYAWEIMARNAELN